MSVPDLAPDDDDDDYRNNDNPCYNDTLRKERELSLLQSSTVVPFKKYHRKK